MKKTVVLLFVFVLLISAIGTASADMIKTPFDGWGYTIGLLAPPDCAYPNGNEHCRGLVLLAENDMGRLSGYETVTMNWNFRDDGSGPWWGTGEIVDEVGELIWDVTYTGNRDEDLHGYLNCVAHGHGEYAGLKAFYTGVREGPDPTPFHFSGYILEKDTG